MKFFTLHVILICLLSSSCVHIAHINNEKEGEFNEEIVLDTIIEKNFELDSTAAPKPSYSIVQTIDSVVILSFLNEYSRRISRYNYNTGQPLSPILLTSNEETLIHPRGYVITSDSAYYIYDMAQIKLFKFKINNDFPLEIYDLKEGEENIKWADKYPQYLPTGSNPIRIIDDSIFLVGQSFKSIRPNMMNTFPTTVKINLQDKNINYTDFYPAEIYGDEVNWEGGLQTAVYLAILPCGIKVFSYPPSHNLLIKNNDYAQWIYGGSKQASTISSISKAIKDTNEEDILNNYIRQPMYGPVIYDPYREYLYRFISLPISVNETNMLIEEKELGIIVLDKKLNYIGELILGKIRNWNWNNIFVTEEGINIEYISDDDNEEILTFKVLKFRKL